MVICLERGADLHMAELMPLPLTVSCFSKIQIGFTFLVPSHLGSPGKRAVKRVCVFVVFSVTVTVNLNYTASTHLSFSLLVKNLKKLVNIWRSHRQNGDRFMCPIHIALLSSKMLISSDKSNNLCIMDRNCY